AKADEKRLKDAHQGADGKEIVEFLVTRSRGKAEPKVLDKLLEDLASKEASVREKAGRQLVAIGLPAGPSLRLLPRDPHAGDAAALAKRLLKVLEKDQSEITGAAVRLLAARRPKGTAEALLAFLPLAEGDAVRDQIKEALAAVAHVSEGKD